MVVQENGRLSTENARKMFMNSLNVQIAMVCTVSLMLLSAMRVSTDVVAFVIYFVY